MPYRRYLTTIFKISLMKRRRFEVREPNFRFALNSNLAKPAASHLNLGLKKFSPFPDKLQFKGTQQLDYGLEDQTPDKLYTKPTNENFE